MVHNIDMATRRLATVGTAALGTAAGIGAYKGFQNYRATRPNATLMGYATEKSKFIGDYASDYASRVGAYTGRVGSAVSGLGHALTGRTPIGPLPPITTDSFKDVKTVIQNAKDYLAYAKFDKGKNSAITSSFRNRNNPKKPKSCRDLENYAKWLNQYFMLGAFDPTSLEDAESIITSSEAKIKALFEAHRTPAPVKSGWFGSTTPSAPAGPRINFTKGGSYSSEAGGQRGGRRRRSTQRKQTRRKTRRNRSN